MKKKDIVNALCILFILLSGIVMVKSLLSLKRSNEISDKERTEIKNDPLTMVDFDEGIINVGDIPRDTIIHHGWVFRNIGEKPLIVYFVSPDCNCTDYAVSKKVALPGDTLQIRLTVDTKNKKNRFMLNTVVRMNTEKGLYVLRLEGNITDREVQS